MKFRKKPVVIDAHEMTEDQFENQEEWPNWLKAAWDKPDKDDGSFFKVVDVVGVNGGGELYLIRTLEGTYMVSVGDFIIRGTGGELYLCKPRIFRDTYDVVTY